MAVPTRIEGDVFVAGTLQSTTQIPSALSIDNSHVKADAAIVQTKLQHQHVKTFADDSATSATTKAHVIHTVQGLTGNVLKFRAGNVVENIGDSVVTVDLLNKGASILTSVITLQASDGLSDAYELLAGTINTAALVADDILEVSIVATIGTGTLAKGVYAELVVEEDSA